MRTKGVIGFGVTEKEAQFSSMGRCGLTRLALMVEMLFMCLILKMQV